MDIQTKKNQNFKNKYLKYKSKYLKYKNVNFGGSPITNKISNIIKERELNIKILEDSDFVSIINNDEDKLYYLQNIFEEIKNEVVPLDLFDSENKLKNEIQLNNIDLKKIIKLMFNYYYIVKGITEIKAYSESTHIKNYSRIEINIFEKLSHRCKSLYIIHNDVRYDVKKVYESVKLLIEDYENNKSAINDYEFKQVYSACESFMKIAEEKRKKGEEPENQLDYNEDRCKTILNNDKKISKDYYINNVMIQTYFKEIQFPFGNLGPEGGILKYYVLNKNDELREFFKEITEKNNDYDNIIKVCKEELITNIKES